MIQYDLVVIDARSRAERRDFIQPYASAFLISWHRLFTNLGTSFAFSSHEEKNPDIFSLNFGKYTF